MRWFLLLSSVEFAHNCARGGSSLPAVVQWVAAAVLPRQSQGTRNVGVAEVRPSAKVFMFSIIPSELTS